MIEAFTGCSAVVDAVKGSRFSLMNGHVTGEYIELVSLYTFRKAKKKVFFFNYLKINGKVLHPFHHGFYTI